MYVALQTERSDSEAPQQPNLEVKAGKKPTITDRGWLKFDLMFKPVEQ